MRCGHKIVKQKRLHVADITCEYWTGLPSWPVTENKPQSRLVAIDSQFRMLWQVGVENSEWWAVRLRGPPVYVAGTKNDNEPLLALRAINSWGSLCSLGAAELYFKSV
jgi:hypothetical protein